MKTRIAVVGVGVVASGEHGDGCPGFSDLISNLADRFDVTVYSLLRADPARVPANIKMRCLPYRTRALGLDLIRLGGMLIADHARRRYRLVHAIAAYPAGWAAVVLCRRLRLPVVISLQGQELANLPTVDFGDLRDGRRAARIAAACRRAGALTALTHFQAAGLAKIGLSAADAQVIPIGAHIAGADIVGADIVGGDIVGGDIVDVLPGLPGPATPCRFLAVSHRHPVKDIGALLRTFRIIRDQVDARLVIAGDGHRDGVTAHLVGQLGMTADVTIIGRVAKLDMHALYRQADFLLHTARYESQGLVFSEAMAAGAVICSTRVGLAADAGTDRCVLARVADEPGLADAVLQVIRDGARYASLRRNARAWAEHFDADWTVRQYADLYEGLCRSGGINRS